MRSELFKNNDISLSYDTATEHWSLKNLMQNVNYDLSSQNNLSPFLQILKEEPEAFLSTVNKAIEDLGLKKEIANTLPIKGAMLFRIQNKMIYWLELSFKWIKVIDIDKELNDALVQVVDDSTFPQALRHQLLKIIKHKQQ